MKVISSAATIGFRLDAQTRSILHKRAELFDRSPHDLARQYVLEALAQEEERSALRQEVSRLGAEIESLRVDLALAVKALLVSAGKVNPEIADAWIGENLKSGMSIDL